MLQLNNYTTEKLFGYTVNVRELPLETTATPSSIKIWQFEKEEYLNMFLTQIDYFYRRALYRDMQVPHFIIYGKSILRLLPFYGQQILIVIVGNKNMNQIAQFIKKLAKSLKLGLDRIEVNFIDKTFIQTLVKDMEKTTVPAQIDFEVEQEKEPTLNFDVYTQGKWQKPVLGFPINGIKIKLQNAEIKYRIYSKNQWQSWVNSHEVAGLLTYPIKGFQFEFIHEHYKLLYKLHYMNGEETQWRDTPMKNPSKKIIDGIELKLEKK